MLVYFLNILIFFCLFPFIFIFMILIFISDFGNPFYFSERLGILEKKFKMIKFRSMIVDADKSNVFSTKENDSRITKIGAILRKYKLDELPQIFNVVLGDMNIVGPRPNVVSELKYYDDYEKKIFKVKPGITDISSIIFNDEGKILENSKDPDQDYRNLIHPWKIALGLVYIKEKSFMLDLKIIFFTLVSLYNKKFSSFFFYKFLKKKNYPIILSEVCLRNKSMRDYSFDKNLFKNLF
jgi:lipopolysaccharide/colanic/teichoic acid biosynthesis glycosyltransferase